MADAVLAGTGAEPLIYTGAAYWDDHVARPVAGDDEGALDACLARPGPLRPDPGPLPRLPTQRADAGRTRGVGRLGLRPRSAGARPSPSGCRGPWAGWQFSAGFNGQGPTYGASSTDIDLNIITEDAWARWTTGAAPAARRAHLAPDIRRRRVVVVREDRPDPGRVHVASGSRSNNVRTVQVRLAVHGYATGVDGYWGPETDGKVRTFQTMRGLAVDGIINVPGQTWDALGEKPAHPTVRPGYQGGFVAVLQRALNALAGTSLGGGRPVLRARATSPTLAAIEAWQSAHGLEVDGVCGQQTWSAIDQAAAAKGYTVA